MSKYIIFETEFFDGKLLIEALAAMGMKGIKNFIGNPQRLEGYEDRLRPETADIIIPKQYVGRASNDIGFKRQPNGSYTAIISDFDRSRYNTQWLKGLKVEYAEVDLKTKAKKAGFVLVN